MVISNGYGDFSVGPLDKLAHKYRHTGTYDEDSFKVEIDNVDDLADALAETQQIAEEVIGDRVWNLKLDVPYSHDDGCYALILGRVFDYLFRQDCLQFDYNTKSGYRLKDGKKIILRGS